MRSFLVLCAALWLSPAAFAQSEEDEARAKELFDNGSILYDEGRYEEAVSAFEAAFALSKKPLLLYNMASALERMGRWDEALEALNGYRAFATADERDTIERRIRSIEERIEERRAEAPEPVPEPEVVEPEPAPAPVVAPAELSSDPETRGKPVAVVLIGAGSVGLGVGAVFSGMASQARGQWRSLCVDDLCPSDAEPFIRRDNTQGLVADVGWVLGVGMLGGGVAVALGGKNSADIELVPSTHGLVIRGRL
jgi:hypothetical protein